MKAKHSEEHDSTGPEPMPSDIPCYIFSFTEVKGIQHINTYALNSLGFTKAELIGKKKFEALLTPGSRILFQTHFLPLLNLKGRADELILSMRTKHGSEIPLVLNILVAEDNLLKTFHVAGIPIVKRNEYERGLLETIKNSAKIFSENEALTDLRNSLEANQLKLERKLRETNRLYDEHNQLNKVLSHDLQEPMRKILFYADSLPNDEHNPNHKRAKIINHALKMRKITDSLQRFYSLDYLLDNLDTIDIKALIEEVKAESDAKGSNCDMGGLKDITYKGNPAHLKGLFTELFDNAFKFRRVTLPLQITIESLIIKENIYKASDGKYKYEDFLKIKFSDNGMGFSNHHAPKVFQLFQQLHPNEGLGIGLSYCKKIVALYNGSITVSSTANRGTTFTIMLPHF